MSTQAIDYTSGEYQEKVRRFVQREVFHCVSTLISDLSKWEQGEYYEDILSVCVGQDWESAAYDAGFRVSRLEDEDGFYYQDGNELTGGERSGLWYDTEAEAWRAACEDAGIEPYTVGAYEYWIVSDWLADRLAEKGEMVSKDIHGLTIWGRRTSGQAILLDRVICDIYNELHT